MSSARPIDPTVGEESKVEHTLYWRMGAPRPASCANTPGKCSSIHSGVSLRAVPAIPMARRSANCASRSRVGGSTNRTVGRPLKVMTSMVSVEPVKSSP
jgi:hypothetical protein